MTSDSASSLSDAPAQNPSSPESSAQPKLAGCCTSPWLWVILAGFLLTLPWQWNSIFAIAMADGVAYLTGGVNLVTTGKFTGPTGEPETWFPPGYPLLIGLLSLGGRIDPVAVARLICAGFSAWGLVLVYQATLVGSGRCRGTALLATLVLAAAPLYQMYALTVMSHASATALGLAAFVVWLKLPSVASAKGLAWLGLLVGLCYLMRPEGILLLPLWMLVDAVGLGWREGVRRASIAGLSCCLVISPYVCYLHQQTGRWQLSGKGEVTVAIGRSMYLGKPRDVIDPVTLEWSYNDFEITLTQELGRYWYNAGQIRAAFWQSYRGLWGSGILLAALLGVVVLVRQRRFRFLFGLLAQLSFLAALLVTWCEERMIHAALPVISILAGVGLAGAWNCLRGNCGSVESKPAEVALASGWLMKALSAGIIAWTAAGLLEGGTRMPRWGWGGQIGHKTLLRETGLAFRQQQGSQPPGAMYEYGASLGYYAGHLRRQLPASADLETLVRYARHHDGQHRPILLGLWTREASLYHPSLREAFLADRLPFPKLLERTAEGERVTIYQIPPLPAQGR